MSTPILLARRSASGSRKRASGHSVCLQGPKPGGTAYSAGISVLRRKNRRVRFLAENVILQAGGNILVEPWNFRSASAHNHQIRVQKIANLRQATREPVFESLERGKRGNFTCATSRNDLGALKRIARCALIIRFQSRPGYPSGRIHGNVLWPHSPATPFEPPWTRPLTAIPPPQPVPNITAKTTCLPAPAPSVASETARQLASFAHRTSRPSARLRSLSKGFPINHVELAFFTKPVFVEIVPGIPMPTVALRPSFFSISCAASATTRTVPS